MDSIYEKHLSSLISKRFKEAFQFSLKKPALARYLYNCMRWQKKAAKRRARHKTEGIHVPPFMIFSITHQCNLNCKGCYEKILRMKTKKEISSDKFRDIIRQADELGTSVIFIAGGEPLTRPELFEITSEFRNIIFPVFTNGLLIDQQKIQQFEKQKNIIPLISMEGCEESTNSRRGNGVYEHFNKILPQLKNKNMLWGASITLTSENFGETTSPAFIQQLIDNNCRFFVFVEYVPIKPGTDHLIIKDAQREAFLRRLNLLRDEFPGIFMGFPGDEEQFGGCLAAGRGFVHVSAEGQVEACPFAPYGDTSLKNMSLKDALKSDFLKKIRDNHDQLTETKGGCALWDKKNGPGKCWKKA